MKTFLVLTLLFTLSTTFAQVVDSKNIDNGGSGQYKAFAVTEKTLPDFVVYRPKNIDEAVKRKVNYQFWYGQMEDV